ncbi:hypothetical protein AX17_002253 [Amanita inopinata Kibby_2008]|nr:hypothetical protein AX17_002253 [Amanita inopinata Kibby_2008]
MLKQLHKKTTTFKRDLNTNIPRAPLSYKKHVSDAASKKENVAPTAQKRCLVKGQTTRPSMFARGKTNKVVELELKECSLSSAKDMENDSVSRPVLAEISSLIAEPADSTQMSFDYEYCLGVEEWAADLGGACSSTPRKKSPRQTSRIILTAAEPPMPMPAKIEPNTFFGDDTFDLSDYLNKHCAESLLDMKQPSMLSGRSPNVNKKSHKLSVIKTSEWSMVKERASRLTASFQSHNSTFNLECEVNKTHIEGLMNISLSSMLKGTEIDYSLEFPTGALGRVPHILVAKYKASKKRSSEANMSSERNKASAVSRKGKTSDSKRYAGQVTDRKSLTAVSSGDGGSTHSDSVLDEELDFQKYVLPSACIIDLSLHRWTPVLEWSVMTPERYLTCFTGPEEVAPSGIPSVIVTSPSDGNLVLPAQIEATVDFDYQDIVNGSYKNFLLDASLHDWIMRFHQSTMDPSAVSSEEEEDFVADVPGLPGLLVTSASVTDLASMASDNLDFNSCDDALLDGPLHNRNMGYGRSTTISESEIPQLLVTSPSDGDLCANVSPSEIMFEIEDIMSQSYKDHLLDASLHNWNMRFNLNAVLRELEEGDDTSYDEDEVY